MLRRILNRLKTNLKLFLLLLALVIFAAVAFPRVAFTTNAETKSFSGVEPITITNGKIPFLFKFGNSLDFYGGSELVFNVSNNNLSQTEKEELLTQFEYRLRKLGLSGYEVFIRNTTSQTQLVARIPVEFSEEMLLARVLALAGDVSFATPAQTSETDTTGSQQSLIPSTLTKDDVEGVNVTYGADTGGYGLIIDFKDTSVSQLLIYLASDINQNSSGLVLQIDGASIAGQSVIYSSANQNGKVTFGTGVGNDTLSANLIRDLITEKPLSQSLSFNSSASKSIAGKYDNVADVLKVLLSLIALLWIALKLFKQGTIGMVTIINVLFVVLGSIGLLKVLNFPLTLVGIAAMLLALAIWSRHSRTLLPIININQTVALAKPVFTAELKEKKNSYSRFLIVSTLALILVNYSQLPAVVIFANFFAITTFWGWLSYQFSLPVSYNLVWRKAK